MRILWISAAVRNLSSTRSFLYHDITGAATQISVMDGGGSRKGQANWNINYETGSRRYYVGVVANYRVRDGEAWRCLDPGGIPARAWYRRPLWTILDMEPTIMHSRIDLAQARERWRCHNELSTPMHEEM